MDGTGMPIVPGRAPPNGLKHSTGEVSVRPYPSTTGRPVWSSQRSATEACSAMPPATDARRCRGGWSRNHCSPSRPLNRVLTPEIQVTG
jgi:hypothetical protein